MKKSPSLQVFVAAEHILDHLSAGVHPDHGPEQLSGQRLFLQQVQYPAARASEWIGRLLNTNMAGLGEVLMQPSRS